MRIDARLLLIALLLATPAFAAGPEGDVQELKGEQKGKVFKDMQEATKRFRDMTRDYDREMKTLVLREVRKRQRFLERSYGKRIEDVDVVQRQRRLEAIAALERFVRQYPNHPVHTPDAMFRLAELYFEKAQVDNEVLVEQYERDLDLYERGKLPSEPDQPKSNFAEATKLYDEILRRFKDFRFRDVALYMKGYTQFQTGLDKAARDTWLNLAQNYPKSKYAHEAWMRVGEFHFDFGEWQLAEQAYTASARYPDGKFYDMVLYKLAWTYFQRYDYDRAIRGFKSLIGHYDAAKKAGKESAIATALRQEAIDYLARSLAEDDWDGDGEADENAGVARALAYLKSGEPFELEILEAYAKSLYELHDQDKYKESAEVYRVLLDRDRLNPRNPELHEKLIETFDLARDLEGAAKEREELVKRYAKGTAWYRANLGNAAATIRADRLVETALKQRATFHHAAAQELKVRARTENKPELLDKARAEYLAAASAYKQYLAQYPHRKDTLDIMFLRAEALFYADEYLLAAEAYAEVRDLKLPKNKYLEAAAFSAIKSVEEEIGALIARKKVDGKVTGEEAVALPEAKEDEKRGTKIVRAKPEKVPAVTGAWVQHSDKYVELALKNDDLEDFPIAQSYRVAVMFFNYYNFDEARKRLEAIINKWPLKKEAGFAAFNIISSYQFENDWQNIEKWTAFVEEKGIGRPEDLAVLRKQLKDFKLGRQFDRAVALFEEKRYVEAAKEFERVVAGEPNPKVADKALFSAAMAYQNAKHWNSAARVFEKIAIEPRFKGSSYREDALFFLAENNRKFFDFEKSVSRYLDLKRSFPKSKRAFFALYKAAELEEMQGNLSRSAELYKDYSREFSGRDDAAQAYYRAGLVYEKLGDERAQLSHWKEFVKRYSATPGFDQRILEAWVRLARIHKSKNKWNDAKKAYERTIAEFAGRGLEPGSAAAGYAAESKFELIEQQFTTWSRIQLEGSMRKQQKASAAKLKRLQELEGAYIEIFPYQAFGWTIAAFFRVGQLYQGFAQFLYKAPDPPGLDDEMMDEYRTIIEDQGLKWENVAIDRFEVAVLQARKLKVVNDWSAKALKAINKFKPAEYPLFKSEKRAYDTDTVLGRPVGPPDPESKPADKLETPDAPEPDAPKGPEAAPPEEPAVPGEPLPPAKDPDAVDPAPDEPVPAPEETAPAEPAPVEPAPIAPSEPEPDEPDVPEVEPEDVPVPDGGGVE